MEIDRTVCDELINISENLKNTTNKLKQKELILNQKQDLFQMQIKSLVDENSRIFLQKMTNVR